MIKFCAEILEMIYMNPFDCVKRLISKKIFAVTCGSFNFLKSYLGSLTHEILNYKFL